VAPHNRPKASYSGSLISSPSGISPTSPTWPVKKLEPSGPSSPERRARCETRLGRKWSTSTYLEMESRTCTFT